MTQSAVAYRLRWVSTWALWNSIVSDEMFGVVAISFSVRLSIDSCSTSLARGEHACSSRSFREQRKTAGVSSRTH